MAKAKHRFVFEDHGYDLTIAQSVNDLLKAVYDTLEVHRTLASVRGVLHRDMSIFSILMYPHWGYRSDHQVMKHCPPLVDDILDGELRELGDRKARCIVINLDNSVKAEGGKANTIKQPELQRRTGTPPYISRAVSNGIFCYSHPLMLWSKRMPLLSGEAKDLYVKILGEERYNKYKDTPNCRIFHGGVPPEEYDEEAMENKVQSLAFSHRWEYDAESVFWTMYTALLRVTPVGSEETPISITRFNEDLEVLRKHSFPKQRQPADSRDKLLAYPRSHFVAAFPEVMAPVACLLQDIATHVTPSYAMMDQPPPHNDHLHEAMQRLILQYLVDNRATPIPLVPGTKRAIPIKATAVPIHGTANGTAGVRQSQRTQEQVVTQARGAEQEYGSERTQGNAQRQRAQAPHVTSRPRAKVARGIKRLRDPTMNDDVADLRRNTRRAARKK
ncbi:hypothetical protein C8Q70DRAFT_1055657 [Cubamyces menziesii]|nr:hypothetical protein C8Q70DRAFT_1055657 [Cubamyces menziesii]